MTGSSRASELVRAVASMADSLDLEVLAEGVETKAEQQALLSYNCVLAQGFYYSRGVPMGASTLAAESSMKTDVLKSIPVSAANCR